MTVDTKTVHTKPRPLGKIAAAKVAVVSIVIIVLGVSGAAASTGSAPAPQVSPAAAATGTAGLSGELFRRTELYFGMNKQHGGEVSDEDFEDFLKVEVTERFPEGLTLLSGLGQYKGDTGVTKEKSKLLILLYPFKDQNANREIEEIRTEYKTQLDQSSVLRVDTIQLVSF